MTAMSDELIARVQELASQGKSQRQIAVELHLSKTAVARALKPDDATKTEPPDVFLDAERRFFSLLQAYGIPKAATVTSYVSSFGSGTYSDVGRLQKLLQDQAVAPPRAAVISKHWAQMEGLIVPPESPAEHSQKPDTWLVINGTPVKDPEGDLTFSQAMRIAALEHSQPSHDGDLMTLLLKNALGPSPETAALKAEVQQLREALTDQRLAGLSARLDQVAQGQGTVSRLDVLGKGLSQLGDGLNGIRSDLKPGLSMIIERSFVRPPQRTPEQKASLKAGFEDAIARAQRAQTLARELWPDSAAQPATAQASALTSS
jgi:hypothetical protein